MLCIIFRIPFVRSQRILSLILAASFGLWLRADPVPEDKVVQMDPVRVNADPFRVLGAHGEVKMNLFHPSRLFVRVTAVNPGSVAAAEGLLAGDQFLEIAGKSVNEYGIRGLRAVLKEQLTGGAPLICLIKSQSDQAPRIVKISAMAEPKHLWLPTAFPNTYGEVFHEGVPKPQDNSIISGNWKPKGNATPQAALESVMYYHLTKNISELSKLIFIDGREGPKTKQLYTNLPEAGREYYQSPKGMIAAFVANELTPIWFRIRYKTLNGPSNVLFDIDCQYWSAADIRSIQSNFEFVGTSTGWQWKISDESIISYLEYFQVVPFKLSSEKEAMSIAWEFRSH